MPDDGSPNARGTQGDLPATESADDHRPRGLSGDLPRGIPVQAVDLEFVRSRGAGGQHVNKVATAVALTLRVAETQLSPNVQARLLHLAGSKASKEGVLRIRADRHRTQSRNRKDAFARLADLVRDARVVPKIRRPTKPSRAAKQRRLDQKNRRGGVKKLRRNPPENS